MVTLNCAALFLAVSLLFLPEILLLNSITTAGTTIAAKCGIAFITVCRMQFQWTDSAKITNFRLSSYKILLKMSNPAHPVPIYLLCPCIPMSTICNLG